MLIKISDFEADIKNQEFTENCSATLGIKQSLREKFEEEAGKIDGLQFDLQIIED